MLLGGLLALLLTTTSCASNIAEPVTFDQTTPYGTDVSRQVASTGIAVYPQSAKAAGTQGEMRIVALIGRNGELLEARIASSSGSQELDEAALSAVGSARFRPPPMDPTADRVRVIIPIRFRLR
jgi:periplasmic protein TonB